MNQKFAEPEATKTVIVPANEGSQDVVISNYVRESVVAESKGQSIVHTQFASALLALSCGNYITNGAVFTTPLAWLGIRIVPGSAGMDVSVWISIGLGVSCLIFLSLVPLKQRFAAAFYYLCWFIVLGTAFLSSGGSFLSGSRLQELGTVMILSIIYGALTGGFFVLPSILVVGGLVSTFRKLKHRRSAAR
ncbi:MAG TPA: hypothetical protein VK171_05595 [Fimbriimonas sp.]|nr:hypothetical protein [Fimbriimonas sp.]